MSVKSIVLALSAALVSAQENATVAPTTVEGSSSGVAELPFYFVFVGVFVGLFLGCGGAFFGKKLCAANPEDLAYYEEAEKKSRAAIREKKAKRAAEEAAAKGGPVVPAKDV